MEQSGNIPVFNIPGILFRNIPQNFIGNFYRIYWEYLMGMFHEYSTNVYLPGGNHRLAKLIVVDFHAKLCHISIKQALTEIRQKFWKFWKGRHFIRNILRKCITCKKFNSKSYQYPTTPPLTKLRMCDNYSFYTTGVDNFGPLFVKSMLSSDSSTMHKVSVNCIHVHLVEHYY